ncbi:MAG: Lrp/AsnC family transcriptional regulator [Sphingomonadales bacterium]
MAVKVDQTDRKILEILLKDATTSKAEIARSVGIAASAVFERIKKLEAAGVIEGYEARINAAKLGFDMLTYVFVAELKPNQGVDTAGALAKVSGVEEVHKIAGEDCFLVKLRTTSAAALSDILDDEINVIPTVSRVRTTIVLKTIAEKAVLSGCSFE